MARENESTAGSPEKNRAVFEFLYAYFVGTNQGHIAVPELRPHCWGIPAEVFVAPSNDSAVAVTDTRVNESLD